MNIKLNKLSNYIVALASSVSMAAFISAMPANAADPQPSVSLIGVNSTIGLCYYCDTAGVTDIYKIFGPNAAFYGQSPHIPAGTYMVTFEGDGDFKSQTPGVPNHSTGWWFAYNNEPGKFTMTPGGGDSQIDLYITRNNVNNPLHNIHVWMPGYANSTKLLRDEYVNALQGFGSLRYMDDMHTNGNLVQHWADRTKLTDTSWTGANGAPVELLIEEANRSGAHPWFNVPFHADDDYVTQLAQQIYSTLDKNRLVFVEYSNEVWNWGFEQAQAQIKLSAPGHTEGFYGQTSWYPYRSEQIFRIFENVFGKDSNRLVRVIAGQASWPGRNDWLLKEAKLFAGTNKAFDVLAVAPYMSTPPVPVDSKGNATISTSAYINLLSQSIDTVTKPQIVADAAIAKKYGIPLVAYEGGQSLATDNGNNPLTTFYTAVNHDQGMYNLYTHYLDVWFQNGGTLINLYNFQGTCSAFGCWGMKDYYDTPVTIAAAPKLKAVMDYMKKPQANALKLLQQLNTATPTPVTTSTISSGLTSTLCVTPEKCTTVIIPDPISSYTSIATKSAQLTAVNNQIQGDQSAITTLEQDEKNEQSDTNASTKRQFEIFYQDLLTTAQNDLQNAQKVEQALQQ